MATSNEIAAFEDFKFKIGDVVQLITDKANGEVWCGMVLERALFEDSRGAYRMYFISNSESSGLRTEIELELWQRSVRM